MPIWTPYNEELFHHRLWSLKRYWCLTPAFCSSDDVGYTGIKSTGVFRHLCNTAVTFAALYKTSICLFLLLKADALAMSLCNVYTLLARFLAYPKQRLGKLIFFYLGKKNEMLSVCPKISLPKSLPSSNRFHPSKRWWCQQQLSAYN